MNCHANRSMGRRCLHLLIGMVCTLMLWLQPAAANACVPGLDWGMERSHLEERLGVALTEASDRTLEAHGLTIGAIPVKRLRLQLGDQGLKQLAYELEPDAITEGKALQQVWVWNTGTDCITAVRAGDDAFLLSYRPSRLNPALL
ncbi:MAG: hypothetical protein EBZ29_04525 [Synechococcaceae bacterium WB9_4xC_028]|nr:hypothetical protein [Synechococcaceae bacterium WB9_4xB_025]NDD68665.1 hypothetical protein [Synechococcaceae bacterium WB9_4xC_028]